MFQKVLYLSFMIQCVNQALENISLMKKKNERINTTDLLKNFLYGQFQINVTLSIMTM